MSKKKVELTSFSGWSESRVTKVKQVLDPENKEDLDQREESIERIYLANWKRVETGDILITGEISSILAFGVVDSFEVYVITVAGTSYIKSTTVTTTLDSAKSNAEHRAQKWLEQYSAILLPTIN